MKSHKQIADLIVLSMMGAIIFAAKIAFEPLPNIHPIAMLVMVLTIVYRVKALVSVYIFALLLGLYNGFPVWWISHLYVWLILWAVTMLLPRNMSDRKAMIVYPIVSLVYHFGL